MLALLLAFDLIGSPFHAHSHDLGPDGLASHALHAAHVAHDAEPVHVEADEAAGFGHSLAALIPAQLQLGKWQPVGHVSIYGPQRTICTETLTPVARVAWGALRARLTISTCLHLRPEGRAPPLLHA